MSNERQESFPIHRPYACGMCNHGDWTSGSVVTPCHMISACTQKGHTRLDTVHKGRHCVLTIPRRLTQRGMAIVAGRWSRRLVKAKP